MMLGGSAETSNLNQWVIIGLHPRQVVSLTGNKLTINGQQETITDAETLFARLEHVRQSAQSWPAEKQQYALPMAGGLAGCIGYGFYRWCDSGWTQTAHKADADWPDLILCEFKDWLFIQLATTQLTVLSTSVERSSAYRHQWQNSLDVDYLNETPLQSAPPMDATAQQAYLETFDASYSPAAFETAVEDLKTKIRQGEIYQANLSIQLQKKLTLDPAYLFERLCLKNPSPFSGFFKWPEGMIVCNSPERLMQVNETGLAQTRPIAGTRGRGKTDEEDETIGQTLLNNEKERAEHLMLVDLARNDLGRLCKAGTVTVDDLLVLERYSHVTHLVSNVQGQLQDDCTGWDVLQSLFPGGTITGCPKIRCVDILNETEPVSRGFYTGGMGYLDAASRALDFNILIRSLFLRPTASSFADSLMMYNAAIHVGAGIVHDAVGPYEYRECLRKATASLNELAWLENVRPARQTNTEGTFA